MADPGVEVDAARVALIRARAELLGKLAAEPAWLALQQLEARMERGEAPPEIDYDELRTRLCRRLDQSVGEWRRLGAIEAAIAALGGTEAAVIVAEPPPLPSMGQESQPERTRYAPGAARPAAVVSAASPPPLPRSISQYPRPAEARALSGEGAPARREEPAARRIAAALGLAGDGPARLSALEAEIECMVHRDAATWNEADAGPRPSVRSELAHHRAADQPASLADEADVEIFPLAASKPADPASRPITRLADRLQRVEDGSPGDDAEPLIAHHGPIEEAAVEIVVLDGDGSGVATGADERANTETSIE